MRTLYLLLLAAATLGLAGARSEPPQYLEGGALIVHVVPELGYSVDPPSGGWCASYAPYAIHSCEEQNNRVDVAGQLPVTWFLLAAWPDGDKEWCGCEFGFGEYDPGLFGFQDYGPCYPVNGLELPTAGWPGPNEGTVIVAAPVSWTGSYLPVYHFGGYAYSSPGPGVIPVAEDPATGFAGFSNCANPSRSWPATSQGGLGVNTDGILACPVYLVRACCFGDSCTLATYLECSAAGGGWLEAYDACEPEPSPCQTLPLRACCFSDVCMLAIHEQCDQLGGYWREPFPFCDPNPCGVQPQAVCCVGEFCSAATQAYCVLVGGEWHPEWPFT
jgi:hypothetical protein